MSEAMSGTHDEPISHSAQIAVRLNGDEQSVSAGTTVADLVPAAWAGGVAVARNQEIVPRAAWPTTTLHAGDAIEIVRPVQGG
jgi:sulfur carrier protein